MFAACGPIKDCMRVLHLGYSNHEPVGVHPEIRMFRVVNPEPVQQAPREILLHGNHLPSLYERKVATAVNHVQHDLRRIESAAIKLKLFFYVFHDIFLFEYRKELNLSDIGFFKVRV